MAGQLRAPLLAEGLQGAAESEESGPRRLATPTILSCQKKKEKKRKKKKLLAEGPAEHGAAVLVVGAQISCDER